MQAILIKVLPTTGSKGTRVKASCVAGSVTLPWNYDRMGNEENAKLAVEALVDKLGWTTAKGYGQWHLGQLQSGEYVAVLESTVIIGRGSKRRNRP